MIMIMIEEDRYIFHDQRSRFIEIKDSPTLGVDVVWCTNAIHHAIPLSNSIHLSILILGIQRCILLESRNLIFQ